MCAAAGFAIGTTEPDLTSFRELGVAGLALLAFWSLLRDSNNRRKEELDLFQETVDKIIATFKEEIRQERDQCDNKIVAGFTSLEASIRRNHEKDR